jgi:hypothetical protein
MIQGYVVSAVERTAKTWKEEADKRRRVSAVDPVADTLDYCAGELVARLQTLAVETAYESVDERARRERVTPQTVRNWIRAGQLAATDGPKGYLIPITAERVRQST